MNGMSYYPLTYLIARLQTEDKSLCSYHPSNSLTHQFIGIAAK